MALNSGHPEHVLTFSSIGWMIGCLADNIKSLQYYEFVGEFIDTCAYLERNRLAGGVSEARMSIPRASVRFHQVCFKYGERLVLNNFSAIFPAGTLNFVQGPNGAGKSTLLRAFTHNLAGGKIYLGVVDLRKIPFYERHRVIFRIGQPSGHPQVLTSAEVDAGKDKDPELIEKLGLRGLFGRSTNEMSGGQSRRMLLYHALISDAWIILLDEILGELSVDATHEVPEGWVKRTIDTLSSWIERHKKIVIIVAHNVDELIPRSARILKLASPF